MVIRIQNIVDWAIPLLASIEGAVPIYQSLNIAPPWEQAEFRFTFGEVGPVRVVAESHHIDRLLADEARVSDFLASEGFVLEDSDKGGWLTDWTIYRGGERHARFATLIDGDGRIYRMLLYEVSPEMLAWCRSVVSNGIRGLIERNGELIETQEEFWDDRSMATAVVRSYWLIYPMLAITICHMKGTYVEEAHESRKARKYRERKGKPVEHVIVIEPGNRKRIDDAAGKGRASQEIRSIVRGHFKRYTPERPLLGKHVGTFWWSPQVRGNEEIEYEVRSPRST